MTKPHKIKTASKVAVKPTNSITHLLVKMFACALIIGGIVLFTDYKGYFDPNMVNNHAQRKWDAYYKFTKNNEVDIVMVGNSHLYTGINPKNLSNTLGANCFILAAPGTTLTDAYYCLKEAIAVCKPKIAIVETFTIRDYYMHQLTASGLSDQYQSFHSRKNISQKLLSMPVLFTSDHYLAAWSNTIRNHSFIFSDRNQIESNIKLKKTETKKDTSLYLGRFVSFAKGMNDSIALKYDTPGVVSVADGNNFGISNEAKEYIRKTVELCRENDIKLVFLTLPMYYRHVNNYDVWKSRLVEELDKYDPVWLDLQSPYDSSAFVPECFENTNSSNQHMSYQGSLIATYKLAHFIHDIFPDVLPDRSRDDAWIRLFYREEGYFENHTPKSDDSTLSVLFKDVSLPNIKIKEVIKIPQKEADLYLFKIDREGAPDLRGKNLRFIVDVRIGEQTFTAFADAGPNIAYNPVNHYLLYTSIMKNITILRIKEATVYTPK